MTAKKSARKRRYTSSSSLPLIFQLQTLIAAVKSGQDLKPPIMKRLYLLLVQLSLNEPLGSTQNQINLKFRDILDLFDIVFEKLGTRFKQFFSTLHDFSANQSRGEEILHSEKSNFTEELTLLLRCCMAILNLFVSDQNVCTEKRRVIFLILSRLLSIELSGGNEENSLNCKKSVSHECTFVADGCTTSVAEEFVASISFLEPSNPFRTFVCALLEVVADELLVHKSLRQYFMLIDSASSTTEKLFVCHFGGDGIGCVLELISAHFILSVFEEQAFENFLSISFRQHSKDLRVFEMSLPSALSLLLHPIILSAPKMFQAYLIVLVSEVINVNSFSENKRPDLRLMNYYLTAFERSVFLYIRHLSSLNIDKNSLGGKFSSVKACMLGSGCQLPFESYLQPATRSKLFNLISNFKSWDTYTKNVSFETNSDLVAASISYVKECLSVLDNSCKDKMLSILSCIILRGSEDSNDTVLLEKDNTSPEDIYLLASILKLMSSSLLQAMLCMRCIGNLDSRKPLSQVSSSKEYEVIIGIIGCFRQFDACLPIQKFLFDIMEAHPTRDKEAKWMLLHLSGLLSLSYASGLDFLVKDCIFTLMTSLNLLFIEGGDLEVFGSLLCPRSDSLSSKYSDKIAEAPVSRKSSKTVASKFQKMRMICTSMGTLGSYQRMVRDEEVSASENAAAPSGIDPTVNIEEEIEETSNGEMFLQCVGVQKSDFDDIADFIQCKPGRDYSDWLNSRQLYRQWKQGKAAVFRWKKKKKIWKCMKGLK